MHIETRGGWNKGLKLSPEFGKKVSDGLVKYYKHNPVSEEKRKNLSKSHVGKKLSQELRERLSQIAKQRYAKGFKNARLGIHLSREIL